MHKQHLLLEILVTWLVCYDHSFVCLELLVLSSEDQVVLHLSVTTKVDRKVAQLVKFQLSFVASSGT